MSRFISLTFTMIGLFLGGCEDHSVVEVSPDSIADSQSSEIPETFSAALDALDDMTTEDAKKSYRNDEFHMGLVHRQIGMRLRNDWGLWSGSKLKDYFSSRGIAHADWISSAIFEGWIERLKTGSLDEKALIEKYAKIESDWRKQWENRVWKDTDGDGWQEAFPREAEQDIEPNR